MGDDLNQNLGGLGETDDDALDDLDILDDDDSDFDRNRDNNQKPDTKNLKDKKGSKSEPESPWEPGFGEDASKFGKSAKGEAEQVGKKAGAGAEKKAAEQMGKKAGEEVAKQGAKAAATELGGTAAGGSAAAAGGSAAAAGGTAAGGTAAAPIIGIILLILAIIAIIIVVVMVMAALLYKPKESGAQGDGAPSVICLDPGHVTNGDNIQEGVSERELTFKVATALSTRLERAGYTVVMTKNSPDATTTPNGLALESEGGCTGSVPEGMANRVRYCKAMNATYMFSIHSDVNGNGPYVIAPPRPNTSCSPNTTQDYYSRNLQYANDIQRGINNSITGSNHGNGQVVVEGDGYVRCNSSHRSCWQLNATRAAISQELDKGLVEMTPNPSWYNSHINETATALAAGITNAIPKTQGGGTCAARAVQLAKSMIGDLYVWGGCHTQYQRMDPPKGCAARSGGPGYDCSGLVNWAWYWGSDKKVDIIAGYGGGIISSSALKVIASQPGHNIPADAQPGDVLGFSGNCNYTSHIGMYIGNGKMVHTHATGTPAEIQDLATYTPVACWTRPKSCN